MSSDAATTPPRPALGSHPPRGPEPSGRRPSASGPRRPHESFVGSDTASEHGLAPASPWPSPLSSPPSRGHLTPPSERTPPSLQRLGRTASPIPAGAAAQAPSATDDDVLARFAHLGARQATPATTAERVAAMQEVLGTRPTRALLDASFMLGNAALGLETAQRREEVGVVFLQVMQKVFALDQAIAAPHPPTQADVRAREALLTEVEQCGRITAMMTQRCPDEGTKIAAAYFQLGLRHTRARYSATEAGASTD